MIALLRTATTAAAAVALAAVAALTTSGGVASAHAEERTITITADGVRPSVLEVSAGDTVRFVNQDRSFAYRARSTGGPWRFDSGPTALLQGDFVVPEPVTEVGSYSYRVAQDAPFHGTVVLGPLPSPTATATASAVPGTAEPAAPGPAVPLLPGSAAASPPPGTAPAVPGALAGEPTGRDLGLPTALAAVLVVGVGSLLLRLLLAEPVPPQGHAAASRRVLSEG